MVTIKEMTEVHRRDVIQAEAKGYQDGFGAGHIAGRIEGRAQGIGIGIIFTVCVFIAGILIWAIGGRF